MIWFTPSAIVERMYRVVLAGGIEPGRELRGQTLVDE
jgi:hypothetical protein